MPLKDDGSTACGCWIYSGYYPGPDKKDNKAAARNGKDPSGLGLYPGWAFSWPVNRRIIYNRCSVDAAGQPWNKDKALVAWDAERPKAGPETTSPTSSGSISPPRWSLPRTSRSRPRSSCSPRAKAASSSPRACARTGPSRSTTRPWNAPSSTPVFKQQSNPVIKIWKSAWDTVAQICDPRYPIIATTFRVTEHWQAGAMTRNLTWQIGNDAGDVRGDEPQRWPRPRASRRGTGSR